jgi:hypothetical protein
MENTKTHIQALKNALKKTAPGWTWFFDDENGIICAQKGREISRVFIAHPEMTDSSGYPTPDTRNDALLIVEALNNLPKLLDAMERVLRLTEELEHMAGRRQRAAHHARHAERYDLFEAHRQSVKRVHAIRRAFLEEVSKAFAINPEPAAKIADYYQGEITDE